MDELNMDELMAAATEVRERAYAPYSDFAVGAAVRGDDGRIYVGANVENTSYGLSLCAERAAVAAAVAGGATEILAVAVAADPPVPPCGACLQVLTEFGPEAAVAWGDGKGEYEFSRVNDLLRRPFKLAADGA